MSFVLFTSRLNEVFYCQYIKSTQLISHRCEFCDEIGHENCFEKKKKVFVTMWHAADFAFVGILRTTCYIFAKSVHAASTVGGFWICLVMEEEEKLPVLFNTPVKVINKPEQSFKFNILNDQRSSPSLLISFPVSLCVRWPHIINDVIQTRHIKTEQPFFWTHMSLSDHSEGVFANWASPREAFHCLFVVDFISGAAVTSRRMWMGAGCLRCPSVLLSTALTDRPVQHKKPGIKVSQA